MPPTQVFSSVVRAFRWHRRWFAAVLAAIAVLAATNLIADRTSGGVAVIVASRSIPGGTTLAAADLTTVWLPAPAVAEGYFGSPESLLGRQVISEVPARRTLTGSDLLTNSASVAPGNLALPVRFSDAGTTAMLGVGSRIDIFGPSGTGGGFAVIASNIRVAAVPKNDSTGILSSRDGGLVMVEVDTTQAAAISAAATTSLSYALR